MKILQVCPGSYLPGIGGISEHIMNITSRLAKNHDVVVYATNPRGKLPSNEIVNDVIVERFRRIAPNGSFFFSPTMILKLFNGKYDIVHGHGYHAFPLHFSKYAHSEKFIVTPHYHGAGHSSFRNFLINVFQSFGRNTFSRARKIIAVSSYEKHLICEQLNVPEEKVVVIPNGVSYKEFSGISPKKKNAVKTILTVGRLEKYKGMHHLVEVLPHLSDDIHLEIVGKGSLKNELVLKAKKLGVFDRISFFEGIPRNELLEKYASADLFVLLSMYEAYSLVVAESLISGTMCLVANTSALTEWVDETTVYGIGVPFELPLLAERLNTLLSLDVSSARIKQENKERILDWDDITKKVEEVYLS